MLGDPPNAGERGCSSPRPQPELTLTAALCLEGQGRGLGGQLDPRGRGRDLGCSCWPFELGQGCWPIPVASSRLVKSCYQNGGVLKTARRRVGGWGGGLEETFKEEINKRGDRLLTLPKGALVYP